MSRNKILFMHKNVFTLSVSFTSSYTKDEPTFQRQKNVILQKIVSGVDKVVNFEDFSIPNKEINYFSRTFKTTTKIQDLFKIVRTMDKGGQGLRSVEQE